MPKYSLVVDTEGGEVRHSVDIDEGETLDAIFGEILAELRDAGDILKDDGVPTAISGGRLLDFAAPLPLQGVSPGDVIRVTVQSSNGGPRPKGISVFLSYSHRDEELQRELDKHLSALKRSGH